jgi:lipopolysaccharide biosynthesis glycosyltransferase
VLIDSLRQHSKQEVVLEAFVSDEHPDKTFLAKIAEQTPGLHFTYIDEVQTEIAKKLYKKYHATYMDAYRWSMKPVFINYLIERKGYDKVLYLDSDLYFYNNPDFLFELLDEHSVLLSPHWRCADDPNEDFHNFKLNFKDGIYNGGFVGTSKEGTEAMAYWANMCLAACEVNRPEGFFVDQKHLDILHSRFEGIGNIRHRGCNISNWNIADCKRSLNVDGEVVINDKFPIVFIHFTASMMLGIVSGEDLLLYTHLEKYSKNMTIYSSGQSLLDKMKDRVEKRMRDRERKLREQNNIINKLRYRLQLRNRIIRFFDINA